MKKIILLGAPGSGKGTVSQFLIEKGYKHISTGDLFRQKLQEDSDEAREIQLLLNRGELIPDSIANKLAKDAIIQAIDSHKGFVLDGFPRTLDQAKYLDTICKIDLAIYLDVNEEILFKRITGRLTCPKCNRIYNVYFKAPKVANVCDVCQIPLVKRRDDNETSFRFRMEEFHTKTKVLINYYENSNKLVKINGNQDLSLITSQLFKLLHD